MLQDGTREFKPTDDQVEKIFGSQELWTRAREEINLVQFLDSTRFPDIDFDQPSLSSSRGSLTSSSSSSSSSVDGEGCPKHTFLRLLRLSAALLEKIDASFLFHPDGRRDWMLCEMLLGTIAVQNASLRPFGLDEIQDELTFAHEELFDVISEDQMSSADIIISSALSSPAEGGRSTAVINIFRDRIKSERFSRHATYLSAIGLSFLLEKISSGQSTASKDLLLSHFSSLVIPGFPVPSGRPPIFLQEAVLSCLFPPLQLASDLQELQLSTVMQRAFAVATNLSDASQPDDVKADALRMISHLLKIEPLQNEEQVISILILSLS